MPIIEPPPGPQTPLCQGDILKGVTLYSTKQAWSDGGEANWSKKVMCLVMSRPCLALRDDWIVVAAIEKYRKSAPATFESLKEAKAFFNEIRDG